MGRKRSLRGGDPETSYYGTLERFLDEIGKTLKPKVHCLISLENRGAGKPDGGLYSGNQCQRGADAERMRGQLPERGAIEVKPPSDPVELVADTKQVKRYFAKYAAVLVTNYRDFLLLGRDSQGKPLPPERYTLAENEADFWAASGHPRKTADKHWQPFRDYILRVMRSVAPLSEPEDVAWFLGAYARDAKARVESHKDLSALAGVREALEEALGMKFTGDKGEHFFRSSLVQTIFYGVFSAWVMWHRGRPTRRDTFNWRISAWSLRVPFIRALYDEVATPNKLGPLGLVEVLDWTAAALNRVNRGVFFEKFRDEHAVQYFYEPFMEAYDPDLRKKLGVWYTPLEIVRYQVARVDTVLREELGLPDGLADPNVVVLDPCCGTGAYLVEVLKRIAETLKAKGPDALIASDLKKAAMTRVFGFEIMPAPFVVSHLQLGLMLHDLGAPLSAKSNERVGVYLTNSLTGWEPPTEEGKKRIKQLGFGFPELEAERDAAEKVKRDSRILVILGNPPYNAFAGISPDEEQGLVELYKGVYFTEKLGKKGQIPKRTRHYALSDPVSKGGWGIKKFNLDDLYIRFFRLAERRIAEMTGRGVVSFISNFSYLSDPSFVVMRQRFLSEFDKLWFDCMNGDSRKTGKLTPEGKPDPSVFSTDQNREGIRVGTAICVVVRKDKREKAPAVRFRQFWGVAKRQDLLASLEADDVDAAYTSAAPCKENRHSFQPEDVSAAYTAWPKLIDLGGILPICGYKENRAFAMIVNDRDELGKRMRFYFDRKIDWDFLANLGTGLTADAAAFDAKRMRERVLKEEAFDEARIMPYLLRPFEMKWCYFPKTPGLWNRNRPALFKHHFPSNSYLVCRSVCDASPEGTPFHFTRCLADFHQVRGQAHHFPLRLNPAERASGKQTNMFKAAPPKANLSPAARAYLADLGVADVDADADTAGLVWLHALAVGYSPAYLAENADGIRRDWPRIPLPDNRKALDDSAELGRQVAALLDTDADVRGVTASPVEPIFRTVGVLSVVRSTGVSPVSTTGILPVAEERHGRDGHATHGQDAHATQLDPAAGDLAVTVGWGHAGKGGATMPGKGRIIARPYDKAELDAIADAARTRGLSRKQAIALLGPDTRDVYLNDKAYWSNVSANVWEYYIGGYQVIKKWLSYREQGLLGRAMSADEAREVTGMARRLTATVLMQPALDDNYRRVAANAYTWKGATA